MNQMAQRGIGSLCSLCHAQRYADSREERICAFWKSLVHCICTGEEHWESHVRLSTGFSLILRGLTMLSRELTRAASHHCWPTLASCRESAKGRSSETNFRPPLSACLSLHSSKMLNASSTEEFGLSVGSMMIPHLQEQLSRDAVHENKK